MITLNSEMNQNIDWDNSERRWATSWSRNWKWNLKPTSEPNTGYNTSGRLPRYKAKCVQRRCFQWGSVPLGSDIKGTELPLPIYWYHSKGNNWLRYNFAADSFYVMKLWNRLQCRNCMKDGKFRYLSPFWGSQGRRRTLALFLVPCFSSCTLPL